MSQVHDCVQFMCTHEREGGREGGREGKEASQHSDSAGGLLRNMEHFSRLHTYMYNDIIIISS